MRPTRTARPTRPSQTPTRAQTEEGKEPGDREAGMMRPRRGFTEDRERVEVLKAMIGRVVGR
jgi:hypothetical protein